MSSAAGSPSSLGIPGAWRSNRTLAEDPPVLRLLSRPLSRLAPPDGSSRRRWTALLVGTRQARRSLRRRWYVMRNRSAVVTQVSIETCTNPLGFSFAPDGWHHLVELLREYDRDPGLRPDQSVLGSFYERYQPDGMADLPVHAGYRVDFDPSFFVYPWGDFRLRSHTDGAQPKDQWRSRFSGPANEARITSDFDQSIALYENIKQDGYRPWRHDFVGGVYLERTDGARRFVVLEGNHRMAVLAHIGVDQVRASYLEGFDQVIREGSVEGWYYVQNGECSRSDALAYFHAFFELDGRERAVELGLATEAALEPASQKPSARMGADTGG